MVIRIAVDYRPLRQLGEHAARINLDQRQEPQTELRRIEDYPVSEVANTGSIAMSESPIGDRLQSGGIPLDTPPIPTVPEQIREDEIDRLNALHTWWKDEAGRDAEECLAKLIEYGSSDFDIMAHSMLAVGGAIWSGVPDSERMRVGREMAIAFYLQGKVARAFGAFEKGRMPSDDTIDDIVRYGMMWKRVRQTGAWS